jgi:RnfABCDGE-type electron transport complex B subunit
MNALVLTILTLSVLGAILAVILYFVAQRFKVEEDPRIDDVEKMLPGANCGGCGFAGCRSMAEALVKKDDISTLYCPVAGAPVMVSIASYLGKSAAEKGAMVATMRCGGSCDKRAKVNHYDGARSCAVVNSLYTGESACAYGCLGYGDCALACQFGAITMNPETGLAEINPDKCTACGACVKACPKALIEMRKKWPKNRAIYVACRSKSRGAIVMKACKAGCIGCGKCAKVCPFGAISMENNLAYIDPEKCKLCRKCVNECPTGAIHIVNMEPLPKEPKETTPKATESKGAENNA